jgi:hypothetical protein
LELGVFAAEEAVPALSGELEMDYRTTSKLCPRLALA